MENKYTKTPSPGKLVLEHLYHVDFMSQEEIGVLFSVSQKVVYRWFKDEQVQSRKPFKRFQKGCDNSSWKGEDVTYSAFHYRVQSIKGKADCCEECGREGEGAFYDWANLTGNYHDINDYKKMCRSCHRHYDKNRKNSSQHVKRRA